MNFPTPTPLQVKEITRSLKEREAKTQAAEAVAAAHLAREKALLEREGALDGRQAAVKKVRAGLACRLYRAGSTKRVQPVDLLQGRPKQHRGPLLSIVRGAALACAGILTPAPSCALHPQAEAAAAGARAEIESTWEVQKHEAARLSEAAKALEERRERLGQELASREGTLQDRCVQQGLAGREAWVGWDGGGWVGRGGVE